MIETIELIASGIVVGFVVALLGLLFGIGLCGCSLMIYESIKFICKRYQHYLGRKTLKYATEARKSLTMLINHSVHK